MQQEQRNCPLGEIWLSSEKRNGGKVQALLAVY